MSLSYISKSEILLLLTLLQIQTTMLIFKIPIIMLIIIQTNHIIQVKKTLKFPKKKPQTKACGLNLILYLINQLRMA